MFASRSKWIALGLVVAAVAAPTALAESPLAAKTEAAGFTAITQYLVQHASQSDTSALAAKTEAKGFLALQPKPVDVAQLGAQAEAKGYRAIVRYQEQLAASPSVPLITDTLAPAGNTAPVQAKARPAVGPWYTPKELKALVAYSNASHNTVGGYSLTAKERAALDAYANASFANKQRILAGEPPVAAQAFPWVAAAAGAVATLGALLIAAAILSRSIRARLRRSFVQTTVTGTR